MNVEPITRIGVGFARDTLVTQFPAEYLHRHCKSGMAVDHTSNGSLGTSWRAFVALGRVKLMPP